VGAGRRRGIRQRSLTAQGISDAFIDAENVAHAIDAGLSGRRPLEEAMADYQVRRDERVKPMYDFTCQLARLEPPPAPMQALFAALHGDREATGQFYAAFTGARPLGAFMNPDNINRLVSSRVSAGPG
jgi:hypothetical protein